MSWKDRLQKAKFKGVEFLVDSTSFTRGRRVPILKLAGQDGSTQQDLGQDPDEIEINAYFGGASFDTQRDAFEAKLLEKGSGPLVLPTRGELLARVVSGPHVGESKDGLGWCTIRFGVVVETKQGGGGGGLKAKTDTSAALKKSAKVTKTVAAADMAKNVDPRSLPSKAVKSTLKAVGEVTSVLRSAQTTVQATLAPLEDLSAEITTIESTVNALLGTPGAVATKVTGVLLSASSLATTAESAGGPDTPTNEVLTQLAVVTSAVVALADTSEAGIDRTTGQALSSNPSTSAASAVASATAALGGTSTLAASPFERAAPARETIAMAKSFGALGATAVASTGISMGAGTTGPITFGTVSTGSGSSSSGGGVGGGGGGSSGGSTSGGSGAGGTPGSGVTGSARGSASLPARSVAEQELVNTRAVYTNIRAIALASCAEIFASAIFDSSTLALRALTVLSDEIDNVMEYGDSDDLYFALSDLRNALAAHLTKVAAELPGTVTFSPAGLITRTEGGAGVVLTIGSVATPLDSVSQVSSQQRAGLPRVVTYDPPAEVPALLIAHEFYGDAELELDIVARNETRYPLFVSDPLEMIEP